jgi:toxin ParE1/3/4
LNYIISDRAGKDLEEISEYIAVDNPKAAIKLLNTFYKTFRNLTEMPNVGHKNTDIIDKDILFWNVKKYLIVYQINGLDINIVRVLSSYRDISGLLE